MEIGEGGQSGGEEANRGKTRWVETRLAEVAALDCLGPERSERQEPLELYWMWLPAGESIPFDHRFEPARKAPPEPR